MSPRWAILREIKVKMTWRLKLPLHQLRYWERGESLLFSQLLLKIQNDTNKEAVRETCRCSHICFCLQVMRKYSTIKNHKNWRKHSGLFPLSHQTWMKGMFGGNLAWIHVNLPVPNLTPHAFFPHGSLALASGLSPMETFCLLTQWASI